MARSKFRVDADDVMDSVEEKIIPEMKEQTVSVEPDKNVNNDSVPDAGDNVGLADVTSASENSEKPEEREMTNKTIIEFAENIAAPASQPGFNYKRKKEKRDVKKILLITPTMHEQVVALLAKTYDEMPFNMLVNNLLREFVEKHGIKIEDDTF